MKEETMIEMIEINDENRNNIKIDEGDTVFDYERTSVNKVNEYDKKTNFSNPLEIIMNDNGTGFCSMIKDFWIQNDRKNLNELDSKFPDTSVKDSNDEFVYWNKYDELFIDWFMTNTVDDFIPNFFECLYEEPFNLTLERVSV